MLTTKETVVPITTEYTDKKARRAAHLAGSLAERLGDGEYLVRPDPRPVFFIRIQSWNKSIEIEELNLEEDYYVRLSNGRRIDFDEDQVDINLEGQESCRFVILSDNGFTSFSIVPEE